MTEDEEIRAATRAAALALAETEMKARGFELHPAKPGHWVERHSGIIVRQHTLTRWVVPAYDSTGAEGLRKVIAKKLDHRLLAASRDALLRKLEPPQ